MRRLRDIDDLRRGLDWLAARDVRLGRARTRVEAVASVPLRLERPGFAPMVEVVCTQHISRASAAAIHSRLQGEIGPPTPASILALDDDAVRRIGLSQSKVATLRAVAEAVDSGLDLDAVCGAPTEEAVRTLCAIRGIGPWTAGVYLMFFGGHPDIMPSADVALQWSASDVYERPERMSARELDALATDWSPWRSVAARLLWANYAVLKGRDVVP